MSSVQQRIKSVEAPRSIVLPHSPPLACWSAVSFAFQDAVWCDWLYREFDGMRVPRALAGRPSRHGIPYPDRISVSPDPADPEQLETYAQTLKTAQHLVVVVSPECSKESLIAEHLRLFRATGGEERIIALVVKGEPASPSAEPGCEADRDWLPKWLQWRFQNNAFEAGAPSEPLVIDARLGVSSLAEVRAQLCAALFEVPVTQLAELGVVIRSSKAGLSMQSSQRIVPMPDPTPLPTLASIAVPDAEPAKRPSRWPIAVCSMAAVAALGCLAMWPNSDLHLVPPPLVAHSTERAVIVAPPKSATPVVAVVAVHAKGAPSVTPAANLESPTPATVAPAPKAPVLVAQLTAPVAKSNSEDAEGANAAPAGESSLAPSAKIVAAVPVTNDVPAVKDPNYTAPEGVSGMVPANSAGAKPVTAVNVPAGDQLASGIVEAQAQERKRTELAARRDRLVRLAESRGNTGEIEEALETYQQAIETAHELVNRTNGGPNEVMELGLLYRRLGNYAAATNSTAEGRMYFARGKEALQHLQSKGKLPKEAQKVLKDLSAGARSRD